MKILSLFDGMSCGQIALERAGIKVDKYYASEIDKYAINVTQANYPNTVQLGDIEDWRTWKIEQPDLIMGGSPCQGFSFAGRRLNFNDPRSKLFFTFVDILKHYKPKYFLFENVKMKKEYQNIISELLGVEPIEINSALVSAQNRKRLYWTNIPNVGQPEDKDILLKDIVESCIVDRDKSLVITTRIAGATEKRYKEKSMHQMVIERPCEPKNFNPKSLCHHVANATDIKGNESIKRVYATSGKSPALTTMQGGHREPKIRCKQLAHGANKGFEKWLLKSPSMTTSSWQYNNLVAGSHITWRKLTPLECERLQTVPDNYTNHVSNTQRYKMLGNGWTVDVIAHILRGIK